MKAEAALLSILCLFVTATSAQDEASELAGDEQGWIVLEGNDMLTIPSFSILQGTEQIGPYDQIPLLIENQSIKGTFWGPGLLAGSNIVVSISIFNPSNPMSAPPGISNPEENGSNIFRCKLSQSGDASFVLNGVLSGMYNLFVSEERSGVVLFATPVLVTKESIIIELPAALRAGDTLKADVSASSSNQSLIYAAIMVASQDYADASMLISSEGPGEALNTTLTLADGSVRMSGMPKISDLLMNAFPLLPQNSAAGLQESTEAEVELQMVTDAQWDKGNYILNCFVFSPQDGLIGARQETIEVV